MTDAMTHESTMTTTTGRRLLGRTVPGVLAFAALALTACAPDDNAAEFEDAEAVSQSEDETEDQSGDDTDTEPSEGETESERSEADSGAEPGAADGAAENSSDAVAQASEGPIDPADALQTVEYNIPASDIDGSITLGLHHLQVKDSTMELLLTFTPEFSSGGVNNLYNLHGNNGGLANPALFDRENLTRYSALRADSESWSTHVVGPRVSSGETIVYWANYAVPEVDIETINVGIPAAPEFEDVEIDWGDSEPSNLDEDDGADSGEGDE